MTRSCTACTFAGLLLLSACADPPPTVYQRIYVKQEIPASLLECADWPVPAKVPDDVKGLTEWLFRAHAAHGDCEYKLEECVASLVAGDDTCGIAEAAAKATRLREADAREK